MKPYTVKVKFIFEGEFIVSAASPLDAKQAVEKHCGLVIGGDIHSSLPKDEVNWNFPLHPNKKIISVRRT